MPWSWRLREAASAYLPLLLMALLALGTWWLVQEHAAAPTAAGPQPPLRHEPDYTMREFTVQRFARRRALARADRGRRGCATYPDTDTLEIDQPRIRARSPPTAASPSRRRGRRSANGDGSEVQLLGDAQVVREAPATGSPAIEFRGEFLHVFLHTERVRSHLPVDADAGRHRVRAPTRWTTTTSTRVAQLKGGVHAASPRRRARRRRPGAGAATARDMRPRLPMSAPLVFITGASSGIGQALAARYHGAGWRLALVARRSAEMRPGREAQRLEPARCRGLRRRRARRRQHRRRRRAPASQRRACPTWSSPTPASASASTPPSAADLEVMRAHLRDQQPRHGGDLPSLHRTRCASAAAARWSASPASPASAACPATAPTAPARRR